VLSSPRMSAAAVALQQPDAAAVPRPVGIRRSAAYLAELESLRGVAILLVLLFHLDGFILGLAHRSHTIVSPAFAFIGAGHSGVSLFFILSAFLLSLPFLAEADGGKRVVRTRYFERRALRILPAYWTAVVVGTLLTTQHPRDLLRGVGYLVFANSFVRLDPMTPYSSVWWSLATEVQFYLLLPFLPLVLRPGAGRRAGVALAVAWAIAYAAFLAGALGAPGDRLTIALSVFGRAPLFALGIAAAALYRKAGDRLRDWSTGVPWLARGGADLVLLGVLATLGFLLRWAVHAGYTETETTARHLWHVAEGGLWTAVVLLVLLAPLRVKPLVCNRAFATLGVLSYSIYLLHVPLATFALRAVRSRAHPLTGWTPTTVGVIAAIVLLCALVASVTYRLVERPFLLRKAKLDA
jgi:peptidoglycan/LPS O-acetylase OafA/YrhL